MDKWTRLMYHPNAPLTEAGHVTLSQAHINLSCEAATEGMVLLKNNGALPLAKGTRVALIGKGTFDYVKGGGGSAEVYTKYIRNVAEGIELLSPGSACAPLNDYYRAYVDAELAKGTYGGLIAEPELPDQLLAEAAAWADTAIVTISRYSAEGWDRPCGFPCGPDDPWQKQETEKRIDKGVFIRGDFCLTDAEQETLNKTFSAFKTVIVLLNVGGVMETGWIRDDERIDGCLMMWQAGMEGGLAAARRRFGDANPSGKLPDTFPLRITDIPSTATLHDSDAFVNYYEDIYVGYRYFETIPGRKHKVCYPFGYGLSYTRFDVACQEAAQDGKQLKFRVTVRNTGDMSGKEVVQLYCAAPQGKLGKPARALAAFAKTELIAPGDVQELHLHVNLDDLASYDDAGAVSAFAWVLEKGDYVFFLGTDVRTARAVHTLTLAVDEVVRQVQSRVAPTSLPCRMKADGSFETLPCTEARSLDADALPNKEEEAYGSWAPEVRARPMYRAGYEMEGKIALLDVPEGKATMEEFLAQLSNDDLIALCGGCYNRGCSMTRGIGDLPEFRVPAAMTSDGPAGLRLFPFFGVQATSFPCATCLASTWNAELVERVGAAGGGELKENNLAVWLAPGVNIHRSPMCGRNFEYYAEDPFLAGHMAGAMIRGIQSHGVSACVKHFACNNKETNRSDSDSRVSERALREIYLKAFEIIVKNAHPMALMTAYNGINGYRASECHDLVTGILREEWGYDGIVVSDWWNHGEHPRELAAGNDVKMPTGFPQRMRDALAQGIITREDLERSARRVCEFLLKLD